MAIYKSKNRKTKQSRLSDIAAGLLCFVFVALSAVIWRLLPPQAEQGKDFLPSEHSPAPGFSAQPFNSEQQIVIVIDAGHGGQDPGALSADKVLKEADITLEIANLLYKRLEKHEEFYIICTRTDDSFLSTTDRANIALYAKADLLLSLHLNSDTAQTSGFQAFAVPPGRVYHEESLRLAQIVCKNAAASGLEPMGKSGIYYAFFEEAANGGYNKEIYDSYWYAHLPQNKGETFGVLEKSGCAAVLLEQWFISNENDVERFANAKAYREFADLIYTSICDYYDLSYINA